MPMHFIKTEKWYYSLYVTQPSLIFNFIFIAQGPFQSCSAFYPNSIAYYHLHPLPKRFDFFSVYLV